MTRPSDAVIVCDASVALAWLLEERAPEWVTEFWDALAERQARIRVPTLFWLEVGNRAVRTLGVTDATVLEAFVRLEALAFETIEMDRPLRLMAVQLARQHRLSIYDAVYLALATTADLPLATLDGRLADAATEMGRRYGHDASSRRSHRTHEKPATYGTRRPVDQVSLAALGAYLAELRQQIGAER